MRLISFGSRHAERPGVLVDDDHYVPLGDLLADFGVAEDMCAVLGLFRRLQEDIADFAASTMPLPLSETRLGPPVPKPRNVIAVAANTRTHVKEAASYTDGHQAKTPMIFAKAASSLCGPFDEIVRPPETIKMDYETELAVVIGAPATRVSRDDAMACVAGYMPCNDISARDIQLGDGEASRFYHQLYRGKSFPTFLPTGPWILTADEVDDVTSIPLRTRINGDLRQDGTVADLVADVPALIESISSCIPLRAGDILVTGTPSGVGMLSDPPRFLEPGDVLESDLGVVGCMRNPVRDLAEPEHAGVGAGPVVDSAVTQAARS